MAEPVGRPVLMLGSVPLPSAESVFTEVSKRIGGLARSIPDGETGERLKWLGWQSQRLRENADFEVVDSMEFDGPHLRINVALYRLRDGVDPDGVEVKALGYAEAVAESYPVFRRLRDRGVIEPGVRMQVSMPSPVGIALLFGPQLHDVLAAIEQAMIREVASIGEVVPADELAIQWDLAIETQVEESLEQQRPVYPVSWPLEDSVASTAQIGSAVPDQALLGFHLCYGTATEKHIIDPRDLTVAVRIANALTAAVPRPIDWLHLPVPQDCDDDLYFAPLRDLELGADTQLYLGLVHDADDTDRARRRLTSAERHQTGFGVGYECGLGRRDPASIPEMLDFHRVVATL